MSIAYDFNYVNSLGGVKNNGHKVNGFQHLFSLFSTGQIE